LNFKGKNLADRDVEILTSKVRNCLFLETLQLFFELKEQIIDNGLNHLLLGIGNLPLSIRNLVLSFRKILIFEERTISLLFEKLVHLKKLEHLTLFSPGNPLMMEESLRIRVRDCQNLKRLNMFILNNQKLI